MEVGPERVPRIADVADHLALPDLRPDARAEALQRGDVTVAVGRAEEGYAIVYYPPSPRAMIEVVDPENPTQVVGYGETGRVRLTTLTKEFFMPRFLERDEAEREAPYEKYPWDGVKNVRPFRQLDKSVVEGVY